MLRSNFLECSCYSKFYITENNKDTLTFILFRDFPSCRYNLCDLLMSIPHILEIYDIQTFPDFNRIHSKVRKCSFI